MAAPMVAATLAIYISYESISNDAQKAFSRLKANEQTGVLQGFSQNTANVLLNVGINNPNKDSKTPYKDAPEDRVPVQVIQDPTPAQFEQPKDSEDIDDADASDLVDEWQSVPVTCRDSTISNADAMILSLRVVMTPSLKVCTPDASARSKCLNFDTSQIEPVNGQTYSLCGPSGTCIAGDTLQDAIKALQFKCTNSNTNTTGGSVEVMPGITVQL
ncbi:hypothetical protein EJ08DRAFT_308592 [Tothia fuscella]|uniref:Uncharacterized protein n=1 Tax=Tothia fuscella TaxID=1048955 RepID=A0A9P4TXL5_9PEZI|nr:hypothetical protein EJ08DRAFT_308592 [Tothia fuscella]